MVFVTWFFIMVKNLTPLSYNFTIYCVHSLIDNLVILFQVFVSFWNQIAQFKERLLKKRSKVLVLFNFF